MLGVWIVEEAQAAHLAAVDFLNRTSLEHVGWVLVQVRFAPSPDGHYVHFEVASQPNVFLKAPTGGSRKPLNPERQAFMASVWEPLAPRLKQAGYPHAWCHSNGWMIRAYLPKHLGITAWSEVRFRATKDQFRFIIHVGHREATGEEADEVLESLREHYEERFRAALPAGDAIEWHQRHMRDRSDYAHVTRPSGFTDGDPGTTADWAASVAAAWLELLVDDPLLIEPPTTTRPDDLE